MTLGLLAWGVGNLWLGAVAGATVVTVYLLLPIAGIVVWRGLRGGIARADVGLAPLAPLTGLFVSAAFRDPLAQLITVALLTGLAVGAGWAMRRLVPRPAGVA